MGEMMMALSAEKGKGFSKGRTNILSYELIETWSGARNQNHVDFVTDLYGNPINRKSNNPARSYLPLVIIGDNELAINHFLQQQRADQSKALRPILVMTDSLTEHRIEIEQLADVVLPTNPLTDHLISANEVMRTLETHVEKLNHQKYDAIMTAMAYYYTRGQRIDPVVDRNAKHAYRYPAFETIIQRDCRTVRDMLLDLSQHRFLEPKHIDRVFVCPSCDDYRVSMKELCGECGSTNLIYQDSIHHFRCGHVAPESEFNRDGFCVCPKCNGAVRHIGVEYNRPGRFSTCSNCNYWSSEPDLAAWCTTCDRYYSPSDLSEILIEGYELSQIATDVLQSGNWNGRAEVEHSSQQKALISRKRNKNSVERLTDLINKLSLETSNEIRIFRGRLIGSPDIRQPDITQGVVLSIKNALQDVMGNAGAIIPYDDCSVVIILPVGKDCEPPTPQEIEKLLEDNQNLPFVIEDINQLDNSLDRSEELIH